MPAKPLSKELAEEAIAAVNACKGNISKAAEQLSIPRGTLQCRLRAAKLQGLEPEPFPVVRATSTLIDAEGNTVLQWIKADHKPDVAGAIKEALQGLKPLPPIKNPTHQNSDLLAVYPWGDPHFGQYSWAEETGDDYDLTIAENLHYQAIDRLVYCTPAAKQAILISVGDTTHGDDSTNQTPASKHQLDVDTRWRKVLKVTVLTFERCIRRLLERHEKVEVIVVPGNHDPHAAAAIVMALAMLYRKNPRVTINESPSKFVYRRFGKVLLGVTHGDTCKLEKLGELMAADQREDWGKTEHRHWFTGHWHHKKFHEGPGWTGEVLRTLAGKDAYAASHAYRSRRDMQSVVFHRERGEIERHRVDVNALEAA